MIRVGYCTNVHAGADLRTMRQQLERHALLVRDQVTDDGPMGIGLWISARAADELREPQALDDLADWLGRERLLPFTLNGFPYGDFHQAVVKHRVYEPTWADPQRADYTLRLAECLDRLLPAGEPGSISTLPLAWRDASADPEFGRACGRQLTRVAEELDRLAQRTGREIVLGLEPEPGCVFDTAAGYGDFVAQHLSPADTATRERLRRHVGVCHDICHSAVMRESQHEAFRTYRELGLRVAKIQVSSAIRLRVRPEHPDSLAAIEQLRTFAEDRYLHQTTVATAGGVRFYDDLPEALAERGAPTEPEEWRIHFHVPIHHDRLGWISSTNDEIRECLSALADLALSVNHFEVETYAWNVLPQAHRWERLADGIAAEMRWFLNELTRRPASGT